MTRLDMLLDQVRALGDVPVLPESWHLDFQTLPESLFTPHDAPINALAGPSSEFRGKLAFERVLQIGRVVRDKCETTNPVLEPLVTDEINRFMEWAAKDGSVSSEQMSLYLTFKTSSTWKIEEKLRLLAALHRRASTSSQTIFGITCVGTRVSIYAMNCDEVVLYTLWSADYAFPGQDLWTALVIALMVMHIRANCHSTDERMLADQFDKMEIDSDTDA